MSLKRGQLVRHPLKPEWGTGGVTEDCNCDVASVYFPAVGLKRLKLSAAHLEVVPGTDGGFYTTAAQLLPSIDLTSLRKLCADFIRDMKNNRANCNDAGVAEDILREMEKTGTLNRATIRRLAAWCSTDGSPYQRGVPTAQAISQVLFGRILGRRDR